jgi:hypothetical protein
MRKVVNNMKKGDWVSGPFPPPGILNTRKYDTSENLFLPSDKGKETYFVGSLRKS